MATGQPDVGDVHVNSVLTNVSIGYQPGGFFAARMFPLVPVDKQTDIYAKYNRSYWARDLGSPGAAPTGSYTALRSPGTRADTTGYTVDVTNTYRCDNWALGFEIPDELRSNADSVFNLDRDATVLLTSLLNIRFDRQFVSDFCATSKWKTDQSISNQWDDYAASTPIEDLREAADTIRQYSLGMSVEGGTRLLLGSLTERRLLDHPDIVDRIKYGSSNANPAKVTLNLIAQILDIGEIVTAKSVYTSDEEGGTAEASITYADIFSDDALMIWTPPSASTLMPSAGYLFNWAPLTGGGMLFTRKGRHEREKVDWIEVHGYLDWVMTDSYTGVYMDDAVD